MSRIIPVYLDEGELIKWCCIIQDTCQTFDDDDPYKEPLVKMRDKLLEELDLSLNAFLNVFDYGWKRLGQA